MQFVIMFVCIIKLLFLPYVLEFTHLLLYGALSRVQHNAYLVFASMDFPFKCMHVVLDLRVDYKGVCLC